MKQQKELMTFSSKLERNEERAQAADRKAISEVKDHTAEHFITAASFTKEIENVYADINGLEKRLNTELKHKMELFAVAWSTATIVIGSGLYLFEHVNVALWK
jgi:hypothetical protein